MLEIKKLSVEIEKKNILQGINKKFDNGKIYAIMGPNGSGKSTLALSIAGHPKVNILEGKIFFKKEDVTESSPDEKSKKGIFVSFQHPIEIEGIPLSKFLRQINNSKEKKETFLKFKKNLQNNLEKLEMNKEILERYLNLGFSGGEKKKSEILQMLTLNPDLIILDEIDSGLDIDSLKTIVKIIKEFIKENKTIIIITHYKKILDYLEVDEVIIMKNGKIAKTGNSDLVHEIEEKGYKEI